MELATNDIGHRLEVGQGAQNNICHHLADVLKNGTIVLGQVSGNARRSTASALRSRGA